MCEHGFGWQEIDNEVQSSANEDIFKFRNGVDLVLIRPIIAVSKLKLRIAASINFDYILKQLEVLRTGEL